MASRALAESVVNPAVLLDVNKLRARLERAHPEQFREAGITLRAISEYARFIELKIRCNDYDAKALSPSPVIDLIWHAHILDTRHYPAFCYHACGTMIHHDPDGGNDAVARAERYRRTYHLYESAFAMKPAAAFWPTPSEAIGGGGAGAAQNRGSGSLVVAQPRAKRARATVPAAPPAAPLPQRLQLTVQSLAGKNTMVQLRRGASALELAAEVARLEGIPVDEQRLLFAGTSLLAPQSRNAPLEQFGVTDGSTILLWLQLRGC